MVLLPPEDPARSALLPTLGLALLESGRLADADRILGEAIERASAGNDPRLEARARVEQQFVGSKRSRARGSSRHGGSRTLPWRILGEHGDDLGQCRAWCLRAKIAWTEGLSPRGRGLAPRRRACPPGRR